MIRIVLAATLCFAALALTACVQGHGNGGGRAAPDLAGALTRAYGVRVANEFPASQRAAVSRCIGQAMASGIPANDQVLIFDGINAGKPSPASQAAMGKWLGGTAVHGPMTKLNYNDPSRLTYADGTVTRAPDRPAERIEANIWQFCRPYTDRLMKTGYLNSAASGGYSKGK